MDVLIALIIILFAWTIFKSLVAVLLALLIAGVAIWLVRSLRGTRL